MSRILFTANLVPRAFSSTFSKWRIVGRRPPTAAILESEKTLGTRLICSKTRLEGTTHEQTIICRQLFAGHVMDSRPIEREEKTHRMIKPFNFFSCVQTSRRSDDCRLFHRGTRAVDLVRYTWSYDLGCLLCCSRLMSVFCLFSG